MSHDAIPHIDNYRARYSLQATARPTMTELFNLTISSGNQQVRLSPSHLASFDSHLNTFQSKINGQK